MNYKEYQEQHIKIAENLKKYLDTIDFQYYLEDSVPSGLPIRPDIIGSYNNEKVFYEIKSGEYINLYNVLKQLNRFVQESNYNRGYLVIPKGANLSSKAINLFKEQEFGLLEFNTTKIDTEPKIILESGDHTKKSEEFIEYSKEKIKWVEKHHNSLLYLKEILLFIICGEILVNGIWDLIFKQNYIYLIAVIPTGIILILIFLFLYKKENYNHK